MKGKITIRTKNLAIQDLSGVLSSSVVQREVALCNAKKLGNDISFIQFENIQENDMSRILSVLSELRHVVREAQIRFVNVVLSEGFKGEFISCLLNDLVGFQTIVGSNPDQEVQIIKALMVDLSSKSLRYFSKRIGGASVKIEVENRIYSDITVYEITLVDAKLWALVKEELAALLSKRKANEKVIINFPNWHASQQDGLLQWLEMIHFKAELEVCTNAGRILYNQIQHLRNRNLCIEFPQNGPVWIGPKLPAYGAQPMELKITERDAGFIQSKLAMMPELRSIIFQRCEAVPLAWEILLNAASDVQSLESLSFVGVQLDEACVSPFIEILPRLSALKELSFDNVDMPEDAKSRMVSSISKLPKLSAFGMANMRIAEGVITAIVSATSIRKLDFRGAEISDEATVEFEFSQNFSEDVEIILFQSKLKDEKLIQILFRSDKFPVANFLYFDSDNKYSYFYSERDHVEKSQAQLDRCRNRNRLIRKLISSNEVISEISFSDMIFSGVCIKPLQLYMQRCPHVVELDLSGSELPDEKLIDLVKVLGNFRTLRKIDFSRSRKPLAPAILANLIFSLPDLSELRLIESETDHTELFSQLLSSDKFPTCSVIFYEGREGVEKAIIQNQTRFEQLRKRNLLVQSLQNYKAAQYENTDLSELDFNYCYFTDHCLPVVFSYMERYNSVKRLSILNNELTETGIQTVCENLPRHPSLQRFEVSRSQYSAATFKILVDSIIKSAHIRQVSFGTMNIPVLEATRCLEGANLEKLEGSVVESGIYNWYRDDVDLCTTEVCTNFFETDQRFKKVRQRNLLIRRFLNQEVKDTILDLNDSAISSAIIPVVCQALDRNEHIRDLIISRNEFDDNAMEELIEAVSKHPNIRSLVLSGNNMAKKSANKLADFLKKAGMLHQLAMAHMNLSPGSIIEIADSLKINVSLSSLDISGNDGVLSSLELFAKALRFNKTLTQFTCLEDGYPKPMNLTLTKSAFGKGSAYDQQFNDYKEKVKKYKSDVLQRRKSVAGFHDVLTKPKSKDFPGLPNGVLIKCILFHQDLFQVLLGGNGSYDGSSFDAFTKKNVDQGLTCTNLLRNLPLLQSDKDRKTKCVELESLLKGGVSLYFTTEEGDTLMHLAARGPLDAVKILVRENVDFDMGIWNGAQETVLDLAKKNGDPKVLAKLMDPQDKAQEMPQSLELVVKSSAEPLLKKLKPEEPAEGSVQGPAPVLTLIAVQADQQLAEEESPLKRARGDESALVSVRECSNEDYLQLTNLLYSENIVGLQIYLEQNPALLNASVRGQSILHLTLSANRIKMAMFLIENNIGINSVNQSNQNPLFFLLSGKWIENPQALLLIVKLLLEKGVSIIEGEGHALHLSVMNGLIRVTKLLLRHGADINYINPTNHHSALTLAVLKQDQLMIELLLTVPELLIESVNYAKKIASKQLLSPKVVELLDRRLMKSFADPHSNIHWLKDMTLCLGSSSPEKTVFIPSELPQYRLMLQNKFTSSMLTRNKVVQGNEVDKLVTEEEGNPVTACFTFIVSARKHIAGSQNERRALSLTLDLDVEHHITKDGENVFVTADIRRAAKERALIGLELSKKDSTSSTHRPPGELTDEILCDQKTFEREFHHGEQSLASALEQEAVLKEVVTRLITHPQFVPGCKIYGIVLDLHSPRYVCSNCEIAILSIQHPSKSKFLHNLKYYLLEQACTIPQFAPLRMITRIGSVKAYDSETVTVEKHLDLCFDLRTLGNRNILQQDLFVTAGKTIQFNSRVK